MEKEKIDINTATDAQIRVYCLSIVATHYMGVAGVAISEMIKDSKELENYLKP